jgi:hypothetical protein
MKAGSSDAGTMSWDIDVPLLNNGLITGGLVKVFAISTALGASMLSLIFLLQGEYDAIGMIWLAFSAIGIGLILFSLLIMLLIFGNRMHCRIRIDGKGVSFETLDRRARTGNRLLLLLGLLSGRPQAAGMGLIATSEEVRSLSWKGAFFAEYQPRRHAVVLRNRWRRLLILYATAENYDAVAERVRAELARHATEERLPGASPLPRYLVQSALVVLACVPLFVLVEEFDVSLMLPLLQLCFGLATVWLIGLFGYVLIALDLVIVGVLLAAALRVRESWLHRGEFYASWTVYSDADWALLGMSLLGMAVLAAIGWRGARGRAPGVLIAESQE